MFASVVNASLTPQRPAFSAAAGRMVTLSAPFVVLLIEFTLVREIPPPVLLSPLKPLFCARLKRAMTPLSMERTTVCALPPR